MTIEGKMIFDDSGDPLEKKVQRAVDYYREKYGREPKICKVSNRYLAESTKMAGVMVVPAQEVGTNNLLVGVEV